MHGQFAWYDLISPDPDGARKFYAPLTNWGTQPFGKDYTMWTTSGAPFAGIYRLSPQMREEGIPPHWMLYVETSDVDATARLTTSLGGKVMNGPNDIPNVGRYAVLQDPHGASFGVYQPAGKSQSWDGTPQIGRMAWHELMTTDHAKAFEFYRKLFGWDKTGDMDMGGGNMYQMYGKGQPFGGMFTRFGDMAGMRPFWLVYIHVPDVQKAFDKAVKAGAMVQRPPMEIPGGTVAILGDPQGAAFALYSATPAVSGNGGASKQGSATSTRGAKTSAKKRATTKNRVAAKKRPAARKRSAAKKRSGAKKRSVTKKRPAARKRSGSKKRRR